MSGEKEVGRTGHSKVGLSVHIVSVLSLSKQSQILVAYAGRLDSGMVRRVAANAAAETSTPQYIQLR